VWNGLCGRPTPLPQIVRGNAIVPLRDGVVNPVKICGYLATWPPPNEYGARAQDCGYVAKRRWIPAFAGMATK